MTASHTHQEATARNLAFTSQLIWRLNRNHADVAYKASCAAMAAAKRGVLKEVGKTSCRQRIHSRCPSSPFTSGTNANAPLPGALTTHSPHRGSTMTKPVPPTLPASETEMEMAEAFQHVTSALLTQDKDPDAAKAQLLLACQVLSHALYRLHGLRISE